MTRRILTGYAILTLSVTWLFVDPAPDATVDLFEKMLNQMLSRLDKTYPVEAIKRNR
jgi:hypothetical protein